MAAFHTSEDHQTSQHQVEIKMSVDEMEGVVQGPSEDFKTNFQLLERAVAQFDTRFTLRALRSISSLRKTLADTKIAQLDVKKPVADVLSTAEKELSGGESKKDVVPEVRMYIGVLIQVFTICHCFGLHI
jgi:26S proteasome regulatory subunit N3